MGGWSATEYDQAERFAEAVLRNSEQLMPIEEIDGDLSKLQCEINKSTEEFDKRIADILNLDLPCDKKSALICDVLKDYPPDPRSEDSPLKLVWEKFIIVLSHEAIEKIEEGASRIFQLYNLVIWGFDPECVILCRAVIDTAFKDRITPEICEKHFGKPRHKYDFSLSDRIQVALNEEIIDEDIAKKARTVKTRGDTAVHKQPNITKDVWGTICDTVAVLKRITRGK